MLSNDGPAFTHSEMCVGGSRDVFELIFSNGVIFVSDGYISEANIRELRLARVLNWGILVVSNPTSHKDELQEFLDFVREDPMVEHGPAPDWERSIGDH